MSTLKKVGQTTQKKLVDVGIELSFVENLTHFTIALLSTIARTDLFESKKLLHAEEMEAAINMYQVFSSTLNPVTS